jgi:predicted nucleic acid-binding protein
VDCLLDTNILLRLFDATDAENPVIRAALRLLLSRGYSLVTSPQNIAEFWNVSTRPSTARGGYGQSLSATLRRVEFIERKGGILPESPAAYRIWRSMLASYGIQGVAVHDARLVALVQSVGVSRVITLNKSDFTRYSGLIVATPAEVLAGSMP